MSRPLLGCLSALTIGLAGIILAPTATATSPYSDAHWSNSRWVGGSTCATTYDPAVSPGDVAIPTDGHSHGLAQTYTGTFTANADSTDITKATFTEHSTGSLGARGSDPSTIWMNYDGHVAITRTKTPSLCVGSGYLDTRMHFTFTLTRPTWVTASISNRGGSFTEVDIWSADQPPYLDLYTNALKFDGSGRALLAAGHYSGYMEGEVQYYATGVPLKGSGTARATFTPAGARTSGPVGTAKPYVSFPAKRDCATHKVMPKVTTNASRAKAISRITLASNGKVRKQIGKPHKGAALTVTLPDAKAANLVATVKLRNGRTLKVKAGYVACS